MQISDVPFADLGIAYANLPFRMAANHQCMPNGPAFQFSKAFWIIVLASRDQRIRTKFHGELHKLETQYQLMSYGIPVNQLPLTNTGNIKTKHLFQWIKARRAIDKARQNVSDAGDLCNNMNIISHPGRSDVLFSRGGNARHYGNVMMVEDIASRLEEFKLNTKNRDVLRKEIMAAVSQRGGKFLTLNKGGWWEELRAKEVHEKITTAFYDHKQKRKKAVEDLLQQQPLKLGDATSIFLLRGKRQKVGESSQEFGCFSFHDPYEGAKFQNPFT